MEMQLKCVLMLSLKEMMLRRVTVLLTNDLNIPSSPLPPWKKFEDDVKYKISKLQIPESLRKKMTEKVRPIRLEITRWKGCLCSWPQHSVQIGFEKLYWTTVGTIDYKKTAEARVGCEELDVEKRYKLASVYCLEDSIPLLWEELDEDRKECFRRKTCFLSYMEVCWPRILKGDFCYLNRLWRTSDRNLTSFNQWAFERSAKEAHKTAAEYFFQKMTHEEREASLMRTTLDVLSVDPYKIGGTRFWFFPDICCFLLSLMTPEQQMQTIKKHPVCVLWCFCLMFWQDLFVENACFIWTFLPTSGYGELSDKIHLIVRNLSLNVKSFREFFLTSPADFKKYFVHHESLMFGKFLTPAYNFIFEFISKYDSESIECIFRNVNVADRTALVFHPAILELLMNTINREKSISMAKVCLREAKLSKKDRERLMELPSFRRVIEELYESHATYFHAIFFFYRPKKYRPSAKKGQKRKLENSSSE